MPPTSRRRANRLGWLVEALFTAAAALGALCLLAAAGGFIFQIHPLVFRSGSMGPQIRTGALGLARTVPAGSVRAGDVVSVVSARGSRVTHRVVSISYAPPVATLRLKGDANADPDTESYVVASADRLFFHVNSVGYVVSALGSRYALFGCGVVVGLLASRALRGRRPGGRPARRASPPATSGQDDLAPSSQERAPRPARRALSTAAIASTGILCAVATPVASAFTDAATATSGSFATRAILATPVLSCGLLQIGSAQFTWTAVPGATAYIVSRTNGGTTTTTTVTAPTTTYTRTAGILETGTVSVRAVATYPSTQWESAPSNSASYTILVLAVALCTT